MFRANDRGSGREHRATVAGRRDGVVSHRLRFGNEGRLGVRWLRVRSPSRPCQTERPVAATSIPVIGFRRFHLMGIGRGRRGSALARFHSVMLGNCNAAHDAHPPSKPSVASANATTIKPAMQAVSNSVG